ncbi:MAG: poly-gamma-glutamate hydrolase family protein [Acidimicrobiales bacterium]
MSRVAELLTLPGVEERTVLAGRLGFLAFHGGLEGGTETVASEAAAASGASLYLLVQPPSVRWHLPSHVVGADPSPALTEFLAHVDVAVAVHGYGRPDRPRDLLLGGRNRELAASLGEQLRVHLPAWQVVDDLSLVPPGMRGLHATNPVNRCRGQGVQLELPPGVRGATGRWVDANTDCVPEAGLIDALIATATAWTAHRG